MMSLINIIKAIYSIIKLMFFYIPWSFLKAAIKDDHPTSSTSVTFSVFFSTISLLILNQKIKIKIFKQTNVHFSISLACGVMLIFSLGLFLYAL